MRVEKKIKTNYFVGQSEIEKIIIYLKNEKKTKADLSRELGITYNYLWRILSGNRPITKKVYKKLRNYNDGAFKNVVKIIPGFEELE